MLARLAQVSLVLEFTVYVAVGAWLNISRGWSAGMVVAAAVATILGARLALVCLTCFLAWLWRSPRNSQESIGWAGVPRYVLGEYRALLTDNLLLLPFERWALRADVAPARMASVPIILVHGYLSNRGYFRPLVHALEQHGRGPLFTPNFPVVGHTIDAFARALHDEIERVATGCGQDKVVLICHSMGGLATREYLRIHGGARLAKVVTIASPHHGTVLASLGMGSNARQMRRGSVFLRRLEAAEAAAPPPVELVSIYSPHDNLVSPQHTSRLAWARNVAVPGVGHVAIINEPRTLELLLAEL